MRKNGTFSLNYHFFNLTQLKICRKACILNTSSAFARFVLINSLPEKYLSCPGFSFFFLNVDRFVVQISYIEVFLNYFHTG